MKIAVLATLLVGAGLGFAFRDSAAGSPQMWIALVLPYLVLSLVALRRFHDDGTLKDVLRPRGGDLTVGFLIAGILLAGGYAVRHFFMNSATPQIVWLYRLALSLGATRPSPLLLAATIGVGAMEELVWRGLVLSSLSESIGTRRAWPVAAVAYALAHLPTVFVLRDPMAGPNPVLLLAALGCGLVWSFAASMTGRLPQVIVSHGIFTYFAIALLLPRFA